MPGPKKHKTSRRPPRIVRRNRNGDEGAAALYEMFHGRPSSETVVMAEDLNMRQHLGALGELYKLNLYAITPEGEVHWEQTFPAGKRPILCASPDGCQLYVEGGDQSVDLEAIYLDTCQKDFMNLGTLHQLTYKTEKGFHDFEPTRYYHDLGEETGDMPILMYDTLNNKLTIVGGDYEIRPEGITN